MEIFDLYTKDREKTDKTMVRGTKELDGYYRLIVHVCIFNKNGQMLIQHRQPFKYGWSNLWDISVGGSAKSGDTSRTAANRELKEELGLDISFENIQPAITINYSKGFDDVYIVERDVDINSLELQYEEVKEVKWADMDEIFKLIDEEKFIPYHKSFIELLFHLRNHDGTRTKKDDTKPTDIPNK